MAYGDNCYWVEFDRSGRLVTASYDGFVRLYGPNFHLLRKAKPPGGERPFSARFSPDGKLIAVGFSDTMAVSVVSGADLSRQYELQTPIGGVATFRRLSGRMTGVPSARLAGIWAIL